MRSVAKFSNGNVRPRLSNWVESLLSPELTGFWEDVPTRLKVPATNIRETEEEFVIELASPGMNKSDFEVNVDNGVITVGYDVEEKFEKEEERYTHKEFGYSSFKRSFTLPDSVDGDKVSAKYNDGILYVSLPKKEEARKKPARLIDVN